MTPNNMPHLNMNEAWEISVAVDTPQFHDSLHRSLAEAAALQKTTADLLDKAQAAVRAADAAAATRRALALAIADAGGSAFAQGDLSASAEGALDQAALAELFSQLEVAESMQGRQIQALIVEPLQTMLDEPRGLGSIPRLSHAYGTLTHDFYESLNEFLALDGDGTSAAAAKAHAKATAKATAKAGAALASTVGTRLGQGFGLFGRKLNQQFGGKLDELTSAVSSYAAGAPDATDANPPPPPPSAPGPPPVEASNSSDTASTTPQEAGGSMGDAARDALAELRSGSTTLSDTQVAVLRHQAGMIKTRHALEARLLDGGRHVLALSGDGRVPEGH